MKSLMETGTDWTSARGMDPRQFFEVMGKSHTVPFRLHVTLMVHSVIGLDAVVKIDAEAGGKAYATI